jgi:hypothetical protein
MRAFCTSTMGWTIGGREVQQFGARLADQSTSSLSDWSIRESGTPASRGDPRSSRTWRAFPERGHILVHSRGRCSGKLVGGRLAGQTRGVAAGERWPTKIVAQSDRTPCHGSTRSVGFGQSIALLPRARQAGVTGPTERIMAWAGISSPAVTRPYEGLIAVAASGPVGSSATCARSRSPLPRRCRGRPR